MTGRHTERSTLAACVAQIVGAGAADLPLEDDELRGWLSERGLGLVPIADASTFSWAGSWIARRPARDGSGPRAVVMFGAPSGPIWDPATTTDEILDGWVIAPLELASWPPPSHVADLPIGTVEALVIAPDAVVPTVQVDAVVAHPDRGIEGDRYFAARGTFAAGRPGSALTLVDAEVLEELAAQRGGQAIDHRRNVVTRGTDLNALVGREFTLGPVRCRGRRLCEPCAHLDRLNGGQLLRPMVHRGGLRADILTAGTIRVGDALTPLTPAP